MKKACLFIALLLICINLTSIKICAYDYANDILADTEDKLFSSIDDETAEILDNIGIRSLDFKDIQEISFDNFVRYFSDDLKTKAGNGMRLVVNILTVICVMSIAMICTDNKNKDIIEYSSVLIIIVFTTVSLINTVNILLSAIKISSRFLLGYIPVFAGLIAVSGNAATALTYNTFLLTVSEFTSSFIYKFAEKICKAYFSLAIGFCMNRNINTSRFVSAYSKCTSLVIGFTSSVFAALLTVKSVFSANIDTVSAKGIRFIISSFIPVVGSSISEAYSTLIGSIGIIKSSVAIVAIAVSLIINLPAAFEGLFMCLSFNVLSFIAETFDCIKVSVLLKAFSTGVRFLILIEVFVLFILIISTAVMVNIRSGI